MGFHIKANNVALTYSNCSYSKQEVLDYWLSHPEGPLWRPQWWYIVQETHQNGTKHIHACFNFKKQINSTVRDKFKLPGCESVNAQKAYNRHHWCTKYCTKEDTKPLTNVTFTKSKKPEKTYIVAATNPSLEPEEALDIIRENDPSMYIRCFNNLKSMTNYHQSLRYLPVLYERRQPEDYYPFFDICPLLDDWLASCLEGNYWIRGRKPIFFLIGPPGIGKTDMVRSFLAPEHAVYQRGEWNLDNFNIDQTSWFLTIFDDFLWECNGPNQKTERFLKNIRPILLGMDGNVTITDKYRHKTNINAAHRSTIIIDNDIAVWNMFCSLEMFRGCLRGYYIQSETPLWGEQGASATWFTLDPSVNKSHP